MKIEIKALILGCLSPALLLLMPIHSQAQCTWNATGRRYVYQVRQENVIVMTLVQEGGVVAGTATLKVGDRNLQGRVTGSIDGDNFSVEIAWPDNLTGVYNGRIMPTGKMNGGTYDKRKPNSQQAWRTEEPLKCIVPPAPKSDPPKPVKPPVETPNKSTGKPKPTKPQPPPPMTVPGIIASQVIYPHLYATSGFVILTWDAGPDYPHAEVWYKVNNGDDTFLVELGKGSRQMPVERGKYYTYILTDAGKTLATINVVGN